MPKDAIEVLTQQHREAEQLFEQLKDTGGENQELLDTLALELQIHMRIEEDILYPFIRSEVPDGGEMMDEAEEEHKEGKEGLQKLVDKAGSEGWEQVLEMLEQGIKHHVEEEETEVFPKLRETVDEARLQQFGEELEQAAMRMRAEGSAESGGKRTRDELYAEAKEIGIEGRSTMSKDELAEAVEQQQ
ncbi:MAG TPA: hemerythrin domain-containing protein [Acidimicrobiales bacterium]|jgi:iron-sulfur cluster repair protein YtfE (RIC family)|nr:hemerythrin domain-containing protein [Acidimicrobiales bacterium]